MKMELQRGLAVATEMAPQILMEQRRRSALAIETAQLTEMELQRGVALETGMA